MYLAVIFIVFLAVILILAAFFKPKNTVSIKPMLAREEIERLKAMERHSYMSVIFPFTRKIIDKFKIAQKISDRLSAAHSKLKPQEFFNLKISLIVFMFIVSAVILKRIDPLWVLLSAAAGYYAPELWLHYRIVRRREIIASMIPEMVDLIGLCVEAGLDFMSAVQWIVDKMPSSNLVVQELAFLIEEIRWGKPRMQALKDMAKRIDIPEVRLFVSTLIQAERLGTPMSEAFTIISEDTRLQRYHRGERQALKAPLKILIPLILCILPVILIIVAGPILLQFLEGTLFQVSG